MCREDLEKENAWPQLTIKNAPGHACSGTQGKRFCTITNGPGGKDGGEVAQGYLILLVAAVMMGCRAGRGTLVSGLLAKLITDAVFPLLGSKSSKHQHPTSIYYRKRNAMSCTEVQAKSIAGSPSWLHGRH